MDISLIPATIYFVGIAAVVAAPPESNVSRAVVFPEASKGGVYGKTDLMPHETTLNLRMRDFADGTPADFCERIGGNRVENDKDESICSVDLSGARLWMPTAETPAEDATFRAIPSFLTYNRNAMNLPNWYVGLDPEFVAARFEITGGTLLGCNRGDQFIAQLRVEGDGVLYLEQSQRTARIALKEEAIVAIENKPTQHSMASSGGTEMSHFGWYYKMNGRSVPIGGDPIAHPNAVVAPPCSYQMPIDKADARSGDAAASAECSAVFFP